MTHLDTSFLVDLLREQQRHAPGPATDWLEAHADEPLGLSVFVACELEAGAARTAHPQRERQRVRELLETTTVVYPDDRYAAMYGDLLARMQLRGRSIGAMDLLIATTAGVESVPLLTGNTRHFEHVPDLRLLSYKTRT
ncbi:MAG: hypothetical protein A3H97_24705 [Acidobacteria bacterium RIFCSPLOWO2_02_FULL_65_29]|nr:MAG: hypothetical protein A3H97_24705 [Acidobacteria bacterium RIFCSPLOWO2_02_FULL_65_29]